MSGIGPRMLATAAADIEALVPGAVLIRNQVGNLSIVRDGTCRGWLDLGTAEVHLDGEHGAGVARISYEPLAGQAAGQVPR
jgi:hypothetical protein